LGTQHKSLNETMDFQPEVAASGQSRHNVTTLGKGDDSLISVVPESAIVVSDHYRHSSLVFGMRGSLPAANTT